MFEAVEEISSYAKIQNKNFKYFVKKLKVFVGKKESIEIEEDEQHIGVSESKKIDKKHVYIFWEKGNWHLKNLSKYRVYVNKVKVLRDNSIKLDEISAIMIRRTKFYFFQAIN